MHKNASVSIDYFTFIVEILPGIKIDEAQEESGDFSGAGTQASEKYGEILKEREESKEEEEVVLETEKRWNPVRLWVDSVSRNGLMVVRFN